MKFREIFAKSRVTKGQVSPNSRLGQWITLLAGAQSVEVILEIGTWKGLGSTLCIHNGMLPQTKAFSLEVNPEFYAQALKNLPEGSSVRLLFGSIIRSDVLDSSDLTEEEKEWFANDSVLIDSAPDVMGDIPERIDLLVLDGGEFGSWAEFSKLEPRITGFVVLDDTVVRKNMKVDKFLSKSEKWELLDRGTDRHGWSVWRTAPTAR